jgi:hypothetical protein
LRRDKEKGKRDKDKNPPKKRIMVKVYNLLFLICYRVSLGLLDIVERNFYVSAG